MVKASTDKFSASEQALGYIYQARFALFHLLKLPEDTTIFLEKDDDIDFIDVEGAKFLGSLKHKAIGDRITDLSADFWKSVNIWLTRYNSNNRLASKLRFFLFTTSTISDKSLLTHFLPNKTPSLDITGKITEKLKESESKAIKQVATEFMKLSLSERQDFLERIQVFDNSPRIDDLPALIRDNHMRCIRHQYRSLAFQQLEGWWTNVVIEHLLGNKSEGISGYEVSDKLSSIAEECKATNLPITCGEKQPADGIDTETDPRQFVRQLRAIHISSPRIRSAILDYYRAFEQRSVWVRENLLTSREIEKYEDRLIEEWDRYKNFTFENLEYDGQEDALYEAGKRLYHWAEFEAGKIESLRIRAEVKEFYVLRGSFHILADSTPQPKVYWHPKFLDQLDSKALEITS